MSGYVPLAIEMMLVRYWLTHGQPKSIQLLPVGEAFVELRGKDTVTISGKSIVLSRYHLSGKNWRGGWGRANALVRLGQSFGGGGEPRQ